MTAKPAVLITGASAGIGAVYADRFARRGHDLVLVARSKERLQTLAARLRREAGIAVDILPADLAEAAGLARVEARLRDDPTVGVLVNNAGSNLDGTFVQQAPDDVEKLIHLNVMAPARLAAVVAPRFVRNGEGAIVNVGSVASLGPEFGFSLYGATKAFVQFLSQSLNLELGPRGVYVQAVLPGPTRTELWERSILAKDPNAAATVMTVEELVDAAMTGFDRREAVTIPPLPDVSQWDAFEDARKAMLPNFPRPHAADRYRSAA